MEKIIENSQNYTQQNFHKNSRQFQSPIIQGPQHSRNHHKMQPYPPKNKIPQLDMEFHQHLQNQPIIEKNKLNQVRKSISIDQAKQIKSLNLKMISPKNTTISDNNQMPATNHSINAFQEDQTSYIFSPKQTSYLNTTRTFRQHMDSQKFLSPEKLSQQRFISPKHDSTKKFLLESKKSKMKMQQNFLKTQREFLEERYIFEKSFADVQKKQNLKNLQQRKQSETTFQMENTKKNKQNQNHNKSQQIHSQTQITFQVPKKSIKLNQQTQQNHYNNNNNLSIPQINISQIQNNTKRSILQISPDKTNKNSQNQSLNVTQRQHHEHVHKHSAVLQFDFVQLQKLANQYNDGGSFIGHTLDVHEGDLENIRLKQLNKISKKRDTKLDIMMKEQNQSLNINIQNKLKKRQSKQLLGNDQKIKIIKEMLTQYKVLQFIINQENRSYDEIYHQLQNMVDVAHECGEINNMYHLYFLLLRSMIVRDFGDYKNAFIKFKELRIFCNIYKQHKFKLKVYTEIVETYTQIKNLKKAQIYLGKLLKLSWKLKDRDSEIKTYDLIGVNYYYQGKTELANYFHWRSVNDQIEPQTAIRKVGESQVHISNHHDIFLDFNKLQKHALNTDSEEEFELEPIQNSIKMGQSVEMPKIKKINIPIPRTLRQRSTFKLGRTDKVKQFIDEKCDKKQILSHRSGNRNIQQYAVHEQTNQYLWNQDDELGLRCRYVNFENNVPKHKKFITERCQVLEKLLLTLMPNKNY